LALSFLRSEESLGNSAKHQLVLSVPKRLVPAAPLRNLIRRVIRESWRQVALESGQARVLVVMVRLQRLPQALSRLTTAVTAPSPASGAGKVKPLVGRALLQSRPTDRILKRLIRAESEQLFHRLFGCADRSRGIDL
jgi:hypothetical protein